MIMPQITIPDITQEQAIEIVELAIEEQRAAGFGSCTCLYHAARLKLSKQPRFSKKVDHILDIYKLHSDAKNERYGFNDIDYADWETMSRDKKQNIRIQRLEAFLAALK